MVICEILFANIMNTLHLHHKLNYNRSKTRIKQRKSITGPSCSLETLAFI